MAKLIFTAITSLDLFVNDGSGSFEWAAPDDEVHAYVNDLERPIGDLPLRAPALRDDAALA